MFGSRVPSSPDSLLCVCNYASNTGFAWDFIESLYAQLARRLGEEGVRTFVAYPRLDDHPRTLDGSPAIPVKLDGRLQDRASVNATLAFARRENVRVIYLTDHSTWSPAYAALHAGGVRRIVVHDHSSGDRSAPSGLRWAAKWALARLPMVTADVVVAVSDYVANRHIRANAIPPQRVVRVWNGLRLPPMPSVQERPLHSALGLDPERPIVACACRAAPEKGVPVLLRAFDQLLETWPERLRPLLVFMGDGPQFAEIQRTREAMRARDDVILTGYRSDAATLLAGADICLMPSLWQDALPLAVAQPMSLARPVIASNVGGIPEMISDGETGLLVPPGDAIALAEAMQRLLLDPALAKRMGLKARARISEHFNPARQLDALANLLRPGFTR
jgi:glycosyltransferase involved in cell wall biosynthesis